MDDINAFNTTAWVQDRLAELAPDPEWRPNPDAGRVHLQHYERLAKRRARLRNTAVVATLIAFVVILAVPATRGIARQLLNSFYMRTPAAVRSMLPRADRPLFKVEFTTAPALGRLVSTPAEAKLETGFELRLPPALVEQVDSGLAVLNISGLIDGRARINVDDIRAALRKRGIDDVNVPQDWDGVEIGFHVGTGVSVAFLDGTFSQAPRPVLLAPPSFLMIDFTEIALRLAGVSATEAHNSRAMFVESGGGFSVVPADAKSTFRQVSLKSGQGLLFENTTDQDDRQKCSLCAGPHERVLTWSVPDRVFQLRSQTLSVEQEIEFANSVQ